MNTFSYKTEFSILMLIFISFNINKGYAQNCISINTSSSRAILNQPPHKQLPDDQDTISIMCTRAIENFYFELEFAANSEKYFEDSTELTATLTYKTSTFILAYDKGTNIFKIPNNQPNLADGNYSLSVFAKDCSPAFVSCSNCILNYSFVVIYDDDVIPFISIETDPDPPTLSCYPGSVVTLKGTQPPHNGYKPQWSLLVNNQFENIPGATSPNYDASQAGTYRYFLYGPAGCSGSNIIGVNAPEFPDVLIQPDTQILNACAQILTGASVLHNGGADNILFDWTGGSSGVIISGENEINPEIGAPGTYTLEVTRKDNGCTAEAAVRVLPGNIPIVEASISRLPITGRLDCKLKEIKLQVTASQSPTASSFVFDWSDGSVGSEIVITDPGMYNVTATASNSGCKGAAAILITQDLSKPAIQIISPRDTICDNQSITLTALTQEPVVYLWDNGLTTSTNEVSPLVNGTTTYSVTITANDNGCTNSAEKQIEQIDAPQVFCQVSEFTIINGEEAGIDCSTSGDRLTWLATPTNVRNIPASGKGLITGQIFQLDNSQVPGKVIYAFYGMNAGCASERMDVVVTVLPANTEGVFIPELITPNGDGLNDTWEIIVPETITNPDAYKLLLFNRYGAEVYSGSLASQFNADSYPDGTYYYVLSVPDGSTTRGAVTILRRQ